MGNYGGRKPLASHKRRKDDNKSKLRRLAAGLHLGASATPGTPAVSHGAAHSADFQALRTYGKPLAHAAIAGYLIAFLCMLPTTKAGFAAECMLWRDLLLIPGGVAMIVVTVVLLLLRSSAIPTADTNVLHVPGAAVGVTGSVSTPALPTPKHAPTTAPGAAVGVTGSVSTPALPMPKRAPTTAPPAPKGPAGATARSAVKPPTSSAGPSTVPLTAVHKEAPDTEEELLSTLQSKSEAIFYLDEVKRALDEMQHGARELTETAHRDIAGIEKAAGSPAEQIRALHKVCGSLLNSFKTIPDQLTAQAEALQTVGKVFQSLCQQIEEARAEIKERVEKFERSTEAKCRDIDQLRAEINEWMEPTHRILLTEAVYTLGSLAEEHVFGSQGSGFLHPLSLNEIHSMYTTGQLEPKQRRRWDEVMKFVDSQSSLGELLEVDRELRSARYGDAHGTPKEKQDATLEELKEWAATHYSQEKYPTLHRPLQDMLSILAQFSSNNAPCVPDRTFASKMHHTLLQKIFR